MDCWLCVCDCVDGGWMRRSARARAACRTARSDACADSDPNADGSAGHAPKSPRHQRRRLRRQPRSRRSRRACGSRQNHPPPKYGPGIYAHFTTNHGNFIVRFFDKDAPKTVANFVGLAEGKKAWTDPRTGRQVRRPYYSNVLFHRIIPGFMIQGGDPEGTGMGGPGLYVRRRDSVPKPSPQQAGHRVDGKQRAQHQRRAVLHHASRRTRRSTAAYSIFGEVVEGHRQRRGDVESTDQAPTRQSGRSSRVERRCDQQTMRIEATCRRLWSL